MSSKNQNSKENLSDETKLEIKTQIEYYLGDENLKKDSFFHNLIISDANGYLDLDYIMKCKKIKEKGWTKDDIRKGIELSNFVELDKTKEKVRRKNNLKLPELSLLNQKRKKENKIEDKNENETKKKKKEEEPKIFDKSNKTILQIISEEDTSAILWKDIFTEFKKLNPDLNVDYGRFKDNKGHIGIILKEGQNLNNINLSKKFEIEGKKFKVKICVGEDLDNFWKEHGSHYEYCINQREKHKKTIEYKNQNKKKYLDEKISLGGKKFGNIDLVKIETKNILNKYKDGEKIENEDKDFIMDLLKYHHNYEEKIKNMDYICVDRNEKFKYSRCFFVIDKNGNKTDFSSKKCIENITNKLNEDKK